MRMIVLEKWLVRNDRREKYLVPINR